MGTISQRKWRNFALLLLVAGAWWTWRSRVEPNAYAQSAPAPQRGFFAPQFSLGTLGGNRLALSELRGQPVIVNFWASWCPPCRLEMPALQRVYQDFQAHGLVILAINTAYQDELATARGFVSSNGLTFPVLLDQDGAISRLYAVQALPTTFFIDSQGKIHKVVVGGPMAEALLRIHIDQLLQASGSLP